LHAEIDASALAATSEAAAARAGTRAARVIAPPRT
jgi:hypothetical protein